MNLTAEGQGLNQQARILGLNVKGQQIALGSVVALKCGGPHMVVRDISGEGVKCLWHTHDGDDLKEAVFQPYELEVKR